MRKIQLVDLVAQYHSIKDEIDGAIRRILESGRFILGPEVEEFERKASEYIGTRFAVGVGSGTDAILLALDALGIGPEDEVITTPFTFIATTEAIRRTGARVVFADIEEDTYNIDPKQVEKKITRKTKAIIVVHLYGHPAEMDEIIKIAKIHNLRVIEDCAQAFGAEYMGRKVGSIGDVGCFSFFPTKNLGCYGDGGLVTTNEYHIAEKVKALRIHGAKSKYTEYIGDGYKSRLDAIQAAVLSVKLKYIDEWNEKRKENAILYNKLLEDLPIKLPLEREGCKHIYYSYVIATEKRDELQKYLKEKGIETAIYYPIPLHLISIYKDLGYNRGDFPYAEKYADRVLSLPMYPELEENDIEFICEVIREKLGSFTNRR